MFDVEPFIKPTLIRARVDRGLYAVYQSYARGDVAEYQGAHYLAKIEHFTAGHAGRTFDAELANGFWELIPDEGHDFLELSDTPATYGAPGQLPRINAAANGFEWYTPPTVNVATWLSLPDTPINYAGRAGQIVHVNPAADRVEFRPAPIEVPALPTTNGQWVLETTDAGTSYVWRPAPAGGAGAPAADSITAFHIAADAIGASELGPNAVNTSHIVNGTILGEDIADNTVGGSRLLDQAVYTDKLRDGAVTTVKLADTSVTAGKIADNAVTNRTMADLSISTAKLRDDAVTSAKIADGTITEADLAPALLAKLDNVYVGGGRTQDPGVGTWRVLQSVEGNEGFEAMSVGTSGYNVAGEFAAAGQGFGIAVLAAGEQIYLAANNPGNAVAIMALRSA